MLKRKFERLKVMERNIVSAISSGIVPDGYFPAYLYLEDDGWIRPCAHYPGWELTPDGGAEYARWLTADAAKANTPDGEKG
jgi:hypothetical protein